MMRDVRMLAEVSVDDTIKELLLALPDFSVGDQLHAACVNRLMGATPGRHSEFLRTGARFIDIFFPGWSAGPFYEQVSALTGLSDSFWSDFAVAVLCQSMDQLTHDLHRQLQRRDIDATVNAGNASLKTSSSALYSLVFSKVFGDFSRPLAKVDKSQARAQYTQALRDSVGLHALWYAEGLWKSPDWELFHHYIKLLALGATAQEVDALIAQLKGLGLPVPSIVDVGNWRSYTNYLQGHPQVDHGDIDDAARNGILVAVYMPSPSGPGISMAEENSFEFTANGQPGSRFRNGSSSGSCFARGTLVLMSDGTLKPIEQVRPGDAVASPDGARQVALVAAPQRDRRAMYSFNGHPFSFTGTHPFLAPSSQADGAQLLAIEPAELHRWVPTLAHAGVAALQVGSSLVGVHAESPFRSFEVLVESLHVREPEAAAGEQLYDLVLAPERPSDLMRPSTYVVGSTKGLFAVISELPVMARAPYATVAILETLQGTLPTLRARFRGASREPYLRFLERLSRMLPGNLLHQASSLPAPETKAEPAPEGGLAARIVEGMRSVAGDDGDYDWISTAFYERLASTLVDEVEGFVRHPQRHAAPREGDRLVLTVHELRMRAGHALVDRGALRLLVRAERAGVAGETQLLEGPSERVDTPFVRYFHRAILLNEQWTRHAAPQLLTLHVHHGRDPIPLMTAQLHLPEAAALPHRRLRARVHDRDGLHAGDLFADLGHGLSPDGQRSTAAGSSPDDTERLGFSASLGRRMASVLCGWIEAGGSL